MPVLTYRFRTDYFPVYFQACLLSSPIASSVKILPTAIVSSSFSLLSGIMIKKMNKYRPANYFGWTLTIVGFGLLTTLKADSGAGMWGGYQALQAAGSGTIVSSVDAESDQRLSGTGYAVG